MSRGGGRRPSGPKPSRARSGREDPRAAAKRRRREESKRGRARAARRRARRGRLANAAVVLAVAAALAGVGTAVVRSGAGVAFAGDLRVGGRLERLSLPRLEGDGEVDLASFGGRPVVINFFASWCPSCIAEMPDFERVHRELGDRVGFLGVSQQDARHASIELARETAITYPTGTDQRGDFFTAVGGYAMPTTVFVRGDGEIAFVQVGAVTAQQLRDLIGGHLDVEA